MWEKIKDDIGIALVVLAPIALAAGICWAIHAIGKRASRNQDKGENQ